MTDSELHIMDIDSLYNIPGLAESELYEILDELKFEYSHEEPESERDNTGCCVECKSDSLIEDTKNGAIVCTECGMVNSNIIDHGAEWRSFDGKTGNERCSFVTNHFLPQSSLGTTIGGYGRNRIKILHSWSAMPYKERSRNNVIKEIESRCRSANIVKRVEDDAKIIYVNISECKHPSGKNAGKPIIIRGKNRKSLIAACVYIACKRSNEARSPKNIADIFKLTPPDITKGRRTLSKLMQIKKMEYNFNSALPEHFIPRYCKELRLKKDFIDDAIKIARNIKKLNIASVHTPLSVATGCILLLAEIKGINVTKKDIANKFGVSEVTIGKAYSKLKPCSKIITDDKLTDKAVHKIDEIKNNSKLPKHLQKVYDNMKKDWEK